jgi:hypothetical protein
MPTGLIPITGSAWCWRSSSARAGLTFILSGGAAVLVRYGGHAVQPWQKVMVLSVISALWIVVAVYFLGDISAHGNPVVTLAFALRRDMRWAMAWVYFLVQFIAAACGSLLARGFFGPASKLAATIPQPGLCWQAAGFEAIIPSARPDDLEPIGDLSTWWVYLIGPVAGAAYVLRGLARAAEAGPAQGIPLRQVT